MNQKQREVLESYAFDKLKIADAMFAEGEYKSAIKPYSEVVDHLREYENYKPVVLNLFFCLKNCGYYDEAIKHIDKHSEPFQNYKIMELKADLFRKINPKKSVIFYDYVIKFKKDQISAYVKKAEVLHELKPFNKMIENTLKIARKRVSHSKPNEVAILARAYRTILQDLDSAREIIEYPIKKERSILSRFNTTLFDGSGYNIEYWMERAWIFREKDLKVAIESVNRGLALGSDNTEAWELLGDLHCENGNSEKGRDCYQSAMRISPSESIQKKLSECGGRFS